MGLGVVGLEPDRLAMFVDGLVGLPLDTQGDAEVVVGLGVVGFEPDRLAVFVDGLVGLPLVLQGLSCRGFRMFVRGRDLSRIASRYAAMAWSIFPWSCEDAAEAVVGVGVIGLEPDRLAIFGDGLVGLPLVVQGEAEVEVPRRNRARAGSPGGIRRRRGRASPGIVEGIAESIRWAHREVGLEPDRLAEFGDGLVDFPGRPGCCRGCSGPRRYRA